MTCIFCKGDKQKLPYWQNKITNFHGDMIDRKINIKKIWLLSANFNELLDEFRYYGAHIEDTIKSIRYVTYYGEVIIFRKVKL